LERCGYCISCDYPRRSTSRRANGFSGRIWSPASPARSGSIRWPRRTVRPGRVWGATLPTPPPMRNTSRNCRDGSFALPVAAYQERFLSPPACKIDQTGGDSCAPRVPIRLGGSLAREGLIAARSFWQNPNVERLIVSLVHDCLDHMIVLGWVFGKDQGAIFLLCYSGCFGGIRLLWTPAAGRGDETRPASGTV